MKKTVYTLLVLFSLISVIVISSCEKLEQSSPLLLNDSLQATISGRATADLDWTSGGNENVPSGTKVIFKIAMNEFNDQAPADEFLYYEATVGGDGTYSVTLPTHKGGVAVTIIPNDFEYNVQINNNDTQRMVFTSGEQMVTIIVGQTKIVDIAY